MATKNLHYYLLKTTRLCAWLLLPLMLLYICTGYVLCGKFGFGRFMDLETAKEIHQLFDLPLVGLFLVHTSISVYFAMRRWGWIKSRTCA
jgi:hypothetical protein